MLFILLALIIIVILNVKLKLEKNEKVFILIFFALFSVTVLFVFSTLELTKMPIVSNVTKIYKVENGITKDKEFAFYYTETKCVILKKNGENYRKVFYHWDEPTFNLDKDLYFVYNRLERQKVTNWLLFLPLDNVEEFYGLTY